MSFDFRIHLTFNRKTCASSTTTPPPSSYLPGQTSVSSAGWVKAFTKKKFLCLSHGLKKQADTFFIGAFTTCACSQVALYDFKITEKGIKAFFVKHEVMNNQCLLDKAIL